MHSDYDPYKTHLPWYQWLLILLLITIGIAAAVGIAMVAQP